MEGRGEVGGNEGVGVRVRGSATGGWNIGPAAASQDRPSCPVLRSTYGVRGLSEYEIKSDLEGTIAGLGTTL